MAELPASARFARTAKLRWCSRFLSRISPASICARLLALCAPRPKVSSSPFHRHHRDLSQRGRSVRSRSPLPDPEKRPQRADELNLIASVHDGTYRSAQTFPSQAPRFHIEVAHTSIGVHNEHFLHHRRSGSYHLCCRPPWPARLNIWNGRSGLPLRLRQLPSGASIPEPTDSFC
jgi:hypothetical protein